MGNEGQESPRDVASEKQKHPWEVFPDGETSTENGGKKREKKTEKKEGKKFNLPKNKPLIIGAVVLVILIGVGIFFGVKFLTENKNPEGNNGPEAEVIQSVKDKISIEEAATPELAYGIADKKFHEAFFEGAKTSDGFDSVIMLDNAEAFINKQEKESDKLYYQIIALGEASLTSDPDIAKYFFDIVDKNNYDNLDKNQKYAYIISYRIYYLYIDENEEKVKEFEKKLDDEFPEEYLESGTNNKIDAPKWEDK